MPWESKTAYVGKAGVNQHILYVIVGRSKAGKTWFAHQLMAAYGEDEVLIGNTAGILDALLPYKPMIENMRNTIEAREFTDRIFAAWKDGKKLPMWFVVDDYTGLGENFEIKMEAEKHRLKGDTEKDKKISAYKGLRLDLAWFVKIYKQLPMNTVINMTLIPRKADAPEKVMMPGAAFLDRLPRMVNEFLTLRCVTEKNNDGTKSFRRWFDTMGLSGELGGDRTGLLDPEEPPSLPQIHEKLTGIKPKFDVQFEPTGAMTRVTKGK